MGSPSAQLHSKAILRRPGSRRGGLTRRQSGARAAASGEDLAIQREFKGLPETEHINLPSGVGCQVSLSTQGSRAALWRGRRGRGASRLMAGPVPGTEKASPGPHSGEPSPPTADAR